MLLGEIHSALGTHTHTYAYTHRQRKGMEKDIPCKYQPKESRGSDTYITMLPDSASGKESTCQ